MAAWSTIFALSECNYSAVDQKFPITSQPGDYFWSNGYAWGMAKVGDGGVTISVHHGELALNNVQLKGKGETSFKKSLAIRQNTEQQIRVTK
jgi:hypothetical protein